MGSQMELFINMKMYLLFWFDLREIGIEEDGEEK